MRRALIVISAFVALIAVPAQSRSETFTFVFNPNFPNKVRNLVSYDVTLFPGSTLSSVFVKARICLNSVCAVEEKRKVDTCPMVVPPGGAPGQFNFCSALAEFTSPTSGCTYCGEALWRKTFSDASTDELTDQSCGVHHGGPGPGGTRE